MPRAVPRACRARRAPSPGGDTRIGLGGVLAGGLALLGLAAVPVAGTVAETLGTERLAAERSTPRGGTPPASGRSPENGPAAPEASGPARLVPVTETTTVAWPDGIGATVNGAGPAGAGFGDEPSGQGAEPHEGDGEERDEPDEDDGGPVTVWDELADCESGDWDADGIPIEGTARWDYGLEFAHAGYEQFQGGLNFHPATWDEFRDDEMPDHAGHATREQEIEVGERVLAAQEWEAWPVCSEMLDLS